MMAISHHIMHTTFAFFLLSSYIIFFSTNLFRGELLKVVFDAKLVSNFQRKSRTWKIHECSVRNS